MERDIGTAGTSSLGDQGRLPGGSGTQAEAGTGGQRIRMEGGWGGGGKWVLSRWNEDGVQEHEPRGVCGSVGCRELGQVSLGVQEWELGLHALPGLWGAHSPDAAPQSSVTEHPWVPALPAQEWRRDASHMLVMLPC